MLCLYRRASSRLYRSTFHLLFSSKDSENDPNLNFSETRHIPAPTIHRPEFSPLTELGQDSERITSLGEEQDDASIITSLGKEKEAIKDDPSVITWLGSSPREVSKPKPIPAKAAPIRDLKPIETLPFELIPKFVARTKPKKLKWRDAMNLTTALEQVINEAPVDYDNNLQIHLTMGVDPRKSDQFVRGLCRLPHGTGKRLSIAVFADGVQAQKARELNVDLVGGLELIHEILETQGKNVEHIKRCIATPSMMKELTKAGRILGPRGLMPNPKMGTLTENVTEAIEKMQGGGEIEFRVDRMGTMHSTVGKMSFGFDKLLENVLYFGRDVLNTKPPKLQTKPDSKFITGMTICCTDGRGFPVIVPSMIQLIRSRIKM